MFCFLVFNVMHELLVSFLVVFFFPLFFFHLITQMYSCCFIVHREIDSEFNGGKGKEKGKIEWSDFESSFSLFFFFPLQFFMLERGLRRSVRCDPSQPLPLLVMPNYSTIECHKHAGFFLFHFLVLFLFLLLSLTFT